MATVTMFVNGQALSGGTLNDALAGATFLGAVDTAPNYQFFPSETNSPDCILWPKVDSPFPVSCTRSITTSFDSNCCPVSRRNWNSA